MDGVIETSVYDNFIRGIVVEENGMKKISKEKIEALHLLPHEENFLMYILNKKKIKVVQEEKKEEKIDALSSSPKASITLEKIRLYKQNHDEDLRNEIISENLRLVPYVSKYYAKVTGINQDELNSYGYEGLILALEKFDVDRDTAFSTYAVEYIRGYILRGIPEIEGNKKNQFYNDYVNAKNFVEHQNGCSLKDDPELIEDVIDLLVARKQIANNPLSRNTARAKISSMVLNLSLNDEENVKTFEGSGELVDPYDYSELAMSGVLKEEIEQVLDTLTFGEADILRKYYGLDGNTPKTMKEIGEEYGITADKIRQAIEKAEKKIRHPARGKKLWYWNSEDTDPRKFGR